MKGDVIVSLGQRPDRVGPDLHVAVASRTSAGFATGDCDGCLAFARVAVSVASSEIASA